MKCEVCQQPKQTKTSIIDGKYYQSICHSCYEKLVSHETASSGQAGYNRDRDAEEHEADTRQPYSNGQPDKEFIRLYPEQAKTMFSPDEIARSERS